MDICVRGKQASGHLLFRLERQPVSRHRHQRRCAAGEQHDETAALIDARREIERRLGREHASAVWHRVRSLEWLERRWRGPVERRCDEQASVNAHWRMIETSARHRSGGLPNCQDVDRVFGRHGPQDATRDRAPHEQACIGSGDGRGDDLAEVCAKCRERSAQWAFFGSDQAESPVRTSILRSSRLTT